MHDHFRLDGRRNNKCLVFDDEIHLAICKQLPQPFQRASLLQFEGNW